MKRVMGTILALALVLSTVLAGADINGGSVKAASDCRSVAYYADWDIYARDVSLMDIDFSNVTVLNFAFANLDADGNVVVGDAYADGQIASGDYADLGFTNADIANGVAGHYGTLAQIKDLYPELTALISIGGWTWSRNFSDVCEDDAKRANAVQSCVDFCLKYGFDGIDFDWEYPVAGGDNITHRDNDGDNYVALVRELRAAFDAQSAVDGKKYYITIAAGANPTFIENAKVTQMDDYLDWINLMTYDYHGPYEPNANHNTPLYYDVNEPSGSNFSIENTLNAYEAAGVNLADLNLGLAFYGKGWANVNAAGADSLYANGEVPAGEGADKGTWEGGSFEYWDIKANYTNGERGYVRYWDDIAKVPYLYSPETKTFITYDDPESLKYKMDYLKTRGLGGIMYWEAGADKNNELSGYCADYLGIVSPRAALPEMYSSEAVYVGGDRVYYHGCIFEAQWWTQGEGPVDGATNVWKFISTADGKASEPYDAARAYVAGDYVYYNGVVYMAQWWTMAEPGTPEENGAMPWKVVNAMVDGGGSEPEPEPQPEIDLTKVTPWESGKAYVGGDLVLYNNKVYSCGWWTVSTPGEADEYGEYVWTEVLDLDEVPDYQPGNSYVGGDLAKYNGKLYKAQWWTVSVPGEADEYGEYVWLFLFDLGNEAQEPETQESEPVEESSEEETQSEEESEEASTEAVSEEETAESAEASSEAATGASGEGGSGINTGDNNSVALWIVLIGISSVIAAAFVYGRKKEMI